MADVGHTTFGPDGEVRTGRETAAAGGLPAGLARTYEDYVLGKFYADWTFERAGDALRRYEGRDRARGLAFVINQFRERAGFAGVHLSPAIIKRLLQDPAEQVLAEGWDSQNREGLFPLLAELYESLIAAAAHGGGAWPGGSFRAGARYRPGGAGPARGPRQVLHMAQRLEAALPRHRVRPRSGRQEVPTRVLDEDTYPVGGFSSLSTRGSIESLLHSQARIHGKRGPVRPVRHQVPAR